MKRAKNHCGICGRLGHTARSHDRVVREGNGAATVRRCNQCYGPLGGCTFKNCDKCRERKRLHYHDREAYLAGRLKRKGLDDEAPLRVRLTPYSNNLKTGPIPVSMQTSSTCPPSCALYGNGCYAEFGPMRYHWGLVPEKGMTWDEFCGEVARMKGGKLWRYAEMGDLPGKGDELDVELLAQLVRANKGRRGFTYTHKPLKGPDDQQVVKWANEEGFTINLSANGMADADRLADLDIGPVVVVVPQNHPQTSKTPAGRHVIVCPADGMGLTCKECKMCAVPQRKAIVAFRAHGQFKAEVERRIRRNEERHVKIFQTGRRPQALNPLITDRKANP